MRDFFIFASITIFRIHFRTNYNRMKKTAIIFLILFIGAFFYAINSYVPEFNGIDVSHQGQLGKDKAERRHKILLY